MWKLYLVNDDGDRVTPLGIRRVKSKDAFTPHFYPYVTPWKTVHIVTFPNYVGEGVRKKRLVTDDTKTVSLLITGLVGTTEMVWQLK